MNNDGKEQDLSCVILGESEPMRLLRRSVLKASPLESNILISGQSGTGKELVAICLHNESIRKEKPLVRIDCPASDEEGLEIELVGSGLMHCHPDRLRDIGQFELAQGGSVLFDEVADFPFEIQGKLLRFVEKKLITTSGDSRFLDIRIISTTNKNLPELVRKGVFREDLYHRLNVIHIQVPALKDRIEDVVILSRYMLKRVNVKLGTRFTSICKSGLQMLMSYEWPGNVRELENILESAALFGKGDILSKADLEIAFRGSSFFVPEALDQREHMAVKGHRLRETLRKVERDMIVRALVTTNGVQVEAAKVLGLGPKNLWKKIRKHSIDVNRLQDLLVSHS